MTTERPLDSAPALPPPPIPQVVADALAPSPALSPGGEVVASTADEAHRLLREPGAVALGRLANSPAEIAWPGWSLVIRRTAMEMLSDRVSLVAAGCAFYGTLALFPAISMLISVYGLLFDPRSIEPQLVVLRDLLPPAAFQLIAERVETLVGNPPGTLTLRLLLSTAVALWSSAAGTKSLIAALNLAYEEREGRSFLHYQMLAFTMTLCVIGGTALGLATLVALPAAMQLFGIHEHARLLIRLASFGLLVLAVLGGLSLLYRYGPNRRAPKWKWVTPGSSVATVLWVAASAVFSWYVGTFATYDAAYGPLGTVAAVMMWFFVTAYAVLLGAELNAELELQTVRDSTDGPPRPLGHRGAYVADHVAAQTRR